MKSSSRARNYAVAFALLAALVLVRVAAFAQMPASPGGANSLNAAVLKLFGSNNAFSAKAEFRVLNKSRNETDTLPMNFALMDGGMRMEIDMNQFKSAGAVPAFLPTMKQLGLDQTIVITRPDKKTVVSIYPRAKAYAEIPMSKDELAANSRTYKLDKSPQGKETIDGHPCAKNKVTMTADTGDKSKTNAPAAIPAMEAIVWNASDLKDFPLQIELADQESTVIIRFKDVKLSRPDPKQFEAPAGLTKFDSAEALRDGVIAKAQGAGVSK